MLVVFEVRQAWLELTTAASEEGALEEGDKAASESDDVDRPAAAGHGRKTEATATGCAFWPPLLRKVGLKLARNPNVYASILGVAWSSVANRCEMRLHNAHT